MRSTRANRPSPTIGQYTAGPETLGHITALVEQVRPEWDPSLVRIVLLDLVPYVHGNDLAIAALRCAADPSLPGPKALGWRTRHWQGLQSVPPALAPSVRCDTCGKPEDRCHSERIGIDDDHEFHPARPVARQ